MRKSLEQLKKELQEQKTAEAPKELDWYQRSRPKQGEGGAEATKSDWAGSSWRGQNWSGGRER